MIRILLHSIAHTLSLQVLQNFNDCKSDTQASAELFTGANNLARKLVAEDHYDTVFVKE